MILFAITEFIAFFLGCLCTFHLHSHELMSPVMASATIGFIATFIPASKFYRQKTIQATVYCGSFAGMSLGFILVSLHSILMVSVIGVIVILFTKNALNGFGGKLGTIAFFSVTLFMLLGRVL
jgi:hypothetical protein